MIHRCHHHYENFLLKLKVSHFFFFNKVVVLVGENLRLVMLSSLSYVHSYFHNQLGSLYSIIYNEQYKVQCFITCERIISSHIVLELILKEPTTQRLETVPVTGNQDIPSCDLR